MKHSAAQSRSHRDDETSLNRSTLADEDDNSPSIVLSRAYTNPAQSVGRSRAHSCLAIHDLCASETRLELELQEIKCRRLNGMWLVQEKQQKGTDRIRNVITYFRSLNLTRPVDPKSSKVQPSHQPSSSRSRVLVQNSSC